MATGDLTPTLLDRLTDLRPGTQHEVPLNAWEQTRELQEALRRDLAAILNTRRAPEDFDRIYEECTNSLLNFGIVDFTSHNLKKGIEQEQLRKSIEQAIRRFEPRLEQVTVTLQESDQNRPLLRFQVAGVLRTEDQEPVVFEAMLHRDSRRFGVTVGR